MSLYLIMLNDHHAPPPYPPPSPILPFQNDLSFFPLLWQSCTQYFFFYIHPPFSCATSISLSSPPPPPSLVWTDCWLLIVHCCCSYSWLVWTSVPGLCRLPSDISYTMLVDGVLLVPLLGHRWGGTRSLQMFGCEWVWVECQIMALPFPYRSCVSQLNGHLYGDLYDVWVCWGWEILLEMLERTSYADIAFGIHVFYVCT